MQRNSEKIDLTLFLKIRTEENVSKLPKLDPIFEVLFSFYFEFPLLVMKVQNLNFSKRKIIS